MLWRGMTAAPMLRRADAAAPMLWRGMTAAERLGRAGRSLDCSLPSRRPRHYCRGRGIAPGVVIAAPGGFNEAAALLPRKVDLTGINIVCGWMLQ
jgi:hypothetical protein